MNDKNIENRETEVGEDSTKYGEFISSYFAWISLPNQKEKAEELQNMTKKKDKKRKKQKYKKQLIKIDNKSQKRPKRDFDLVKKKTIIIL